MQGRNRPRQSRAHHPNHARSIRPVTGASSPAPPGWPAPTARLRPPCRQKPRCVPPAGRPRGAARAAPASPVWQTTRPPAGQEEAGRVVSICGLSAACSTNAAPRSTCHGHQPSGQCPPAAVLPPASRTHLGQLGRRKRLQLLLRTGGSRLQQPRAAAAHSCKAPQRQRQRLCSKWCGAPAQPGSAALQIRGMGRLTREALQPPFPATRAHKGPSRLHACTKPGAYLWAELAQALVGPALNCFQQLLRLQAHLVECCQDPATTGQPGGAFNEPWRAPCGPPRSPSGGKVPRRKLQRGAAPAPHARC